MTRYTVETHSGEQCVIARNHVGSIVQIYLCGDLSRAEAAEMAKGLAAEQRRVETMRELEA